MRLPSVPTSSVPLNRNGLRPGLIIAAAWVALMLAGCGTVTTREPSVGTLRLIGVKSIPPLTPFQDTLIGGLSGIDYDPKSGSYVAESDDPSEHGPARFYQLRLAYDENSFTSVEVTGVTPFRQRDGTTYPSKPQVAALGGEVADFESVRWDPLDGSIWYTSEGQRPLGMSPFVRHAARDGRFLAELPMPPMFRTHPDREAGPRHNLSFEGLTFAPDGRTLWLAMEAPLYEDGPVPTAFAGAVSRITHFDRTGKILGQYAYPISPLPSPPPPDHLADNGVSELLAINSHQFLVLERAGVQDHGKIFHFSARLFEMDLSGASDVSGIAALPGAEYRPAKKRLLVDFSQQGRAWVDNLEGLTWGPRLANGHATLVVVSDDNFASHQETQFWVFEVLPPGAAKK